MALKIIKGNIFNSKAQTFVNTINTEGVMGAGIALEFRLRYPDMYEKYVKLCKNKMIDIGKLWIYKTDDKWILNFPTKKHWRYPSKIEYLEKGLQKFVDTYEQKGITSIAFPILGSSKGKIEKEKSLEIMKKYLQNLPIEIEIYDYDPSTKDDLFEKFRKYFLNSNLNIIEKELKIKKSIIKKILETLNNEDLNQINQLAKVKGIGIKTLEKIFENKNKFLKQTILTGETDV